MRRSRLTSSARRSDIEAELADIMIYCLLMAHDIGIDVEAAIEDKLAENERKYPPEKSRGTSAKYTEL